MIEWIQANDVLLWWLFAASVLLLLLTPLVVGWLIVRLPADYFVAKKRPPLPWWQEHPLLRPVLLTLKNVAGAILLLVGLVMLLTPGQGLLSLAVGIMLLDFPGKHRLERWLVTRKSVWRSINWLRKRTGREPFTRPD